MCVLMALVLSSRILLDLPASFYITEMPLYFIDSYTNKYLNVYEQSCVLILCGVLQGPVIGLILFSL